METINALFSTDVTHAASHFCVQMCRSNFTSIQDLAGKEQTLVQAEHPSNRAASQCSSLTGTDETITYKRINFQCKMPMCFQECM
jgi:hypothetical protein